MAGRSYAINTPWQRSCNSASESTEKYKMSSEAQTHMFTIRHPECTGNAEVYWLLTLILPTWTLHTSAEPRRVPGYCSRFPQSTPQGVKIFRRWDMVWLLCAMLARQSGFRLQPVEIKSGFPNDCTGAVHRTFMYCSVRSQTAALCDVFRLWYMRDMCMNYWKFPVLFSELEAWD